MPHYCGFYLASQRSKLNRRTMINTAASVECDVLHAAFYKQWDDVVTMLCSHYWCQSFRLSYLQWKLVTYYQTVMACTGCMAGVMCY